MTEVKDGGCPCGTYGYCCEARKNGAPTCQADYTHEEHEEGFCERCAIIECTACGAQCGCDI